MTLVKEDIKDSELQVLRPVTPSICVKGIVSYTTNQGAWNLIRLKRKFLDKFPQLEDKKSKFSYKMIFHENQKDFEKELRKMKKSKDAIPILFFLYKEKEKGV